MTVYHPQTDGQKERAHRTRQQMLRSPADKQLSSWDEMLLCSEFVYNDSERVPTGCTPLFSLSYGMQPLPSAGRIGAAANTVPIAKDPLTVTRPAQSNAKAASAEV